MKYRTFSKRIAFQPSALGFGMMRLPMLNEQTIDVDQSIKMVRQAIDSGVNYLDTAYVYHGGESERIMGKVLKDGYRDKVKIADKMPMFLVKNESDLDRLFNEQLERLQVDKIDFYLLHALSKGYLPLFNKIPILKWLEKKKADGLIDYIGFSFHDKYPIFKKIVDLYNWDFCLMQFNFMDVNYQAGLKGLRYAHSKDMGVVIMEGLRGGQLTMSIPDDIQKLWANMSRPPVQSMFDFIWDFEEVGCIISGMSAMEQVKENLQYANASAIGKLSKAEHKQYKVIREAYLSKTQINCTKCNYCKVCPQKIAIPYIFDQLNEIKRYSNQRTPSFRYTFLEENQRANKCIACNVCVNHCPQQLQIPALLKKCSMVFDEKKAFGEVF